MGSGSLAHLAFFKFLWLWQGPPAIRVSERFMGSGPLVGYVKADQGSDSERRMIHGLRLTGSPRIFKFRWLWQSPPWFENVSWAPAHWLTWPCLSFVGYVKADQGPHSGPQGLHSHSPHVAKVALRGDEVMFSMARDARPPGTGAPAPLAQLALPPQMVDATSALPITD